MYYALQEGVNTDYIYVYMLDYKAALTHTAASQSRKNIIWSTVLQNRQCK